MNVHKSDPTKPVMDAKRIQEYVLRYLQVLECDIIEKGLRSVTVKLSPEADKELTGRPYYWSFVERTGAPPETMTYVFKFETEDEVDSFGFSSNAPSSAPTVNTTPPAASTDSNPAGTSNNEADGSGENILARYLGFVPVIPASRIPEDTLTFGSRRLEQIFQSTRKRGRIVRLFEEPTRRGTVNSIPYDTWLNVNFKVEYVCDMKRSEIHSFGIRLDNSEIQANFYDQIRMKKLTPRLPAGIHLLRDRLSISKAISQLESHLEQLIKKTDHSWSDRANERMSMELTRIQDYYDSLEDDKKLERKRDRNEEEENNQEDIHAQYKQATDEIHWQYRPRIEVSVINCGLFHLPNSD
ncbi:YqhG family protein [Paenibacillus sp. N1-5-1-14]|uniref:YqhG family protein n=1 Tax=Paenibacillus radicibacter TaxID=2972488 RepID=UPI002158DA9A|nr:YqhG family protein [Paenibacillus radicibacter]MCR8643937.1 YqhG family protein [Paenibacillus radicibacter]